MRHPRRRPRSSSDDGMATAELAACLPVLVLLLGVVISAVAVVSGAVHAQDAAREAARATARGDRSAALRLANAAAPGAEVSITTRGADVSVRVHSTVEPLGELFPAFAVTGTAVAASEPAMP